MRIRNLLEMRALQRQLRDRNDSLEVKVAERTQELREAQRQIVAQERLRAFSEMAGGVVHDFGPDHQPDLSPGLHRRHPAQHDEQHVGD